jgi:tRNA A-37 threonylcarbamoyl transferase component Bud32
MPDPDNLLEPGQGPRRFGDYIIRGLLGEGGMARIYAAEEVLSRRPVAIKVLRSEFASSEQGRRRFLTEMAILANLDDPHIVRCLLCTEIEQRPVMVLEQLDGWTLREMLKHRVALPWTEAVRIAYQITKALHTAHSRQPAIVHRDLKPENVMCLRDGRVKVMDFGIAKLLQTIAGSTTHPIGTLQYMSPEHIDARPVDGRSDLFGLGLMLWEMLAGRPPFASDSPRVLLEQICTQPTPPLPDHVRSGLPSQLEPLLARLLAKQPEGRPTSAIEVLALLQPLVDASQRSNTTAPAPTAAAPPIPTAPRIDTLDVMAAAEKGPLRQGVDEQVDEAAEALSQFGRAVSRSIVRILVGLMLYPAAAAICLLVPVMLTGINLVLLAGEQDVAMSEADFETWVVPRLVPVLLISALVFVRSCWAHHREPSGNSLLKPWMILGGLLIAGWAATTGIEFGTDSKLDETVHYIAISGAAIWLVFTLSWATGRMASRVLALLERSRERAD